MRAADSIVFFSSGFLALPWVQRHLANTSWCLRSRRQNFRETWESGMIYYLCMYFVRKWRSRWSASYLEIFWGRSCNIKQLNALLFTLSAKSLLVNYGDLRTQTWTPQRPTSIALEHLDYMKNQLSHQEYDGTTWQQKYFSIRPNSTQWTFKLQRKILRKVGFILVFF